MSKKIPQTIENQINTYIPQIPVALNSTLPDITLFKDVHKDMQLMQTALKPQMDLLRNTAIQLSNTSNTFLKLVDFSYITKQLTQLQKESDRIKKNMRIFISPTSIIYPPEPSIEYIVAPPPPITLSREQEDRIAQKTAILLSEQLSQDHSKTVHSLPEPLIQLPANAVWENIVISFETEDSVVIHCKNMYLGKYTDLDLSFTKNKRCSQSWLLLYALSAYEVKGVDSIATVKTLVDSGFFNNSAIVHATRSNLVKHLMNTFGIHDDPFYNYKEYGGYKPKFILKPLPDLRGNGNIHTQSGSHDLRTENYNDDHLY
ncbi:MAG: hypothetical protein ACKUBY_00120 [Candidatus Moraniibacteriota bacterium]|jgi:hypothetical protein